MTPARPSRSRWPRLPRLPRLGPGELADVAAAQGALLAALLRARLLPTGRLVSPVGDAMSGRARAAVAPPGRCAAIVARTTRAVDRASRRGLFRPTCLVRSLALARLLERRGVGGARIRIGVQRAGAEPGPTPRVHAHAWVELDGRVVGDDPRHVARFTPVGSVTRASWR